MIIIEFIITIYCYLLVLSLKLYVFTVDLSTPLDEISISAAHTMTMNDNEIVYLDMKLNKRNKHTVWVK